MSLTGLSVPARAPNIGADQYDHVINLVDTTKPTIQQSPSSIELQQESDLSARGSSDSGLNRRWTKGTLREELARRKYAKFQEREGNDDGVTAPDGNCEETVDVKSTKKGKKRDSLGVASFRDRISLRSKKPSHVTKIQDYEVDILYENQRGSFFCGIPLYSSKSLLNFDPSSWQTSLFKDSPVDITNAQVPDPTWAWSWKTWYVDMSHDVDEEGWEYSFSFRQGFSWHGSHPWFHSFVRRRRWLRKRVKAYSGTSSSSPGGAHMLNADYFTIHPTRDLSRASSADRGLGTRSSFLSSNHAESESEQEDDGITDVLALLKALKRATVDRRKAELVKNFLEHGGDELHYLPEKMHEIMEFFLYQTSRRQLLTEMQVIYNTKTKHRKEHETSGDPESENEKRLTDDLLQALEAAGNHVRELEYWSDVKLVTGSEKQQLANEDSLNSESKGKGLDPLLSRYSSGHYDGNSDPTETEIKGIPENAHVDEEPGINWDLHTREKNGPPSPPSQHQVPQKGRDKDTIRMTPL
ncbi:hypothetical protein MMC19_001309 [Ptychographa xylographoides]|nr:hypothetical protein [Ptychographa xylographoides]